MRIWSIHPKHLDAKGLVALWRETLLAKHVLEGRTKGYKNHPQLQRFKACPEPLTAINYYLQEVHREALDRGYNFDVSKFEKKSKCKKIKVNQGQFGYEILHLQKKLKERDPAKFKINKRESNYEIHPLFRLVEGEIEEWEVISS